MGKNRKNRSENRRALSFPVDPQHLLWTNAISSSPSLRNCEELFDECLVPVRRFPGRLGQCFSVTYSRRTRGLESRDPKRIDRAE